MATCNRRNQYFLIFSVLCGLLFPQVASFNSWEDYNGTWHRDSPYAGRLYPFTEIFHDSFMVAGVHSVDAEINFELPYFGRRFDSAIIVDTGHVQLTDEYAHIDTGTKWPNDDYPDTPDPAFLGPYYAGVWLTTNDDGRVYWRRLDPSDHKGNLADITRGMLNEISQDVNDNFLDRSDFNATHGLVVTWHEVKFLACPSSTECPRNTFQAAVVTDGRDTFAIYNYFTLKWAGGVSEGCDVHTGLPSQAFPNCFAAQVGFNAGGGLRFFALPKSNTEHVVDLDEISTVGIQGRFMYKISTEEIHRGGCADFETEAADRYLEIWPRHGSMLGGNPIYFAGPCIEPHEMINYRCRFTTDSAEHEVEVLPVVGEGRVGKCIAPKLESVGSTAMSVAKGNQQEKWDTSYFVGASGVVTPHVTLQNAADEWLKPEPHELSFHWDPEDLLDRKDDTPAANLSVTLRLVTYREYEEQQEGNHVIKNEWKDMHTFESSHPNKGSYTFQADDHECEIDCDWGVPEPVGFIVVSLDSSQHSELDARKLWSDPIPVAWYEKKPSPMDDGNNKDMQEWLNEKCMKYYEYEKSQNWKPTELVEACPMTLTQARTEIGRFIVGAQCNWTHPVPCPRIPRDPEVTPHIECFSEVTPHDDGWRARCCYDEDGNIIYSQDSGMWSAPDRVSPYGRVPYNEPGHLPSLSHWVWDKMFRFVCCEWNPDRRHCIEHYAKVRPTTDIGLYERSRLAFAYGDPHYRTFDGVEYKFNGRGEYWLLRVADFGDMKDFMLQARLQKPPNQSWGEIKATVISAAAMQEGSGRPGDLPRVEFSVNFEDGLGDKQVLVFVDGDLKDFADTDKMIQEFRDKDNSRRLIIINNSPITENDQSNFTAIFQNRIAVQVSNRAGALQIAVQVPHRYFEKTAGLLGVWNGKPEENLQTPNGDIIDPNSPSEVIHNHFGKLWATTESESLFSYHAKMNWHHFSQPYFIPYFEEPTHPIWPPPNTNITEEMVNQVCHDYKPCRFDFKITLMRSIGEVSMDMESWSQEMSKMSEEVPACGRIDVTEAIYDFTHYLLSGSMVFTGCNEGFSLRGRTSYACVDDGQGGATWSPTPDIECRANSDIKSENARLAAAIAVPICLALVLATVVIGGIYYFRWKKKAAAAGTGTDDIDEMQSPAKPERKSIGPGDTGLVPDDFVEITPNMDTPTLSTFANEGGDFDVTPGSRPVTPVFDPATHQLQYAGYPNPAMLRHPSHGSHSSLGSQLSVTGIGDIGMTPTGMLNPSSAQYAQMPVGYQPYVSYDSQA